MKEDIKYHSFNYLFLFLLIPQIHSRFLNSIMVTLIDIMRAKPVSKLNREILQHLLSKVGQIKNIFNTVLPVIRMKWSLLKEFGMSFFPQLMEPLLIFIQAVWSIVLFE